MTRPLHIPLSPGLPEAGAPGQWLGRDRHGTVYTLRWIPERQCWGALGWDASDPRQPWPHLVLLRDESENFIIGHVEGPAIAPAGGKTISAALLLVTLAPMAAAAMWGWL